MNLYNMTTTTEKRTHTIDATGKRLGKVATEAASVLMGKDQTDFAKHTVAEVNVVIENASKLDVTDKKKGEIYQSYSGYPSLATNIAFPCNVISFIYLPLFVL